MSALDANGTFIIVNIEIWFWTIGEVEGVKRFFCEFSGTSFAAERILSERIL
jgi:hypothetical protein